MTKRKLVAIVRKWQKLFRLSDWQIVIQVVDGEEIDGNSGQVDEFGGVFLAYIRINNKLPESQIEPTIYHELAHIKVTECFNPIRALFEEDENATAILDECEEQVVRNIEALLGGVLCANAYTVVRQSDSTIGFSRGCPAGTVMNVPTSSQLKQKKFHRRSRMSRR